LRNAVREVELVEKRESYSLETPQAMLPSPPGRKIRVARNQANSVANAITAEIKKTIGSVSPFTETYEFQCDEATDAELAALPQKQLVDRLVAARDTVGKGLAEIDRGCWADMNLMSVSADRARTQQRLDMAR
jgi:hypothetical protein